MKGVTKAMRQMNRQMNLPALQNIMQKIERQNERMEMVTEVMGVDDTSMIHKYKESDPP